MVSLAVGDRGACEACGFDPAQLSPPDAAVAARSLARRWRELLEGVVDREDDGEALLRQRATSGWSPLERVSHVVEVFEGKAERLLRVWEHEHPVLDEVGIDAGRATAARSKPDDLLAQLSGAAERLARVIDRYDGTEWDRTGLRDGHPVTAWQLAAEAIHEASHHLRACRDELAAVCQHPIDGEEAE